MDPSLVRQGDAVPSRGTMVHERDNRRDLERAYPLGKLKDAIEMLCLVSVSLPDHGKRESIHLESWGFAGLTALQQWYS